MKNKHLTFLLVVFMSMAASAVMADTREYVDLGLPSGTLWATCNIGASSPEEYGDYFAWGETTTKSSYSWSNYKYCKGTNTTMTKYCQNSSRGYNGFTDALTGLETSDDAAYVNWGMNWRTPTQTQFEELTNSTYTINEWITLNGKNGLKITSLKNGNSIFLPAAGCRTGDNLNLSGSNGTYWSCTLSDDSYEAHGMGIYGDGVYWRDYNRFWGRSVRPVRKINEEHECVDLGLPSGTLWATCNVGANSPEEYGDYFAWGETTGYTSNTNDGHSFNWASYKWCNGSNSTMTKYCTSSSYGKVDNKTELELEDDAAYVNWGEDWSMPSYDQLVELRYQCEWICSSINGVNGYIVKSKTNGNSIFLPTAGHRVDNSHNEVPNRGLYWSCTLRSDRPSYSLNIYFGSELGGVSNDNSSLRRRGCSVRPVRRNVRDRHEYVDLGLPSGTLWATCNVGANSPEEYGDHFAWGETSPKTTYEWNDYKWCNGSDNTLTKYNFNSSYGIVDNNMELDPEDDAAYVNWGSNWRMPTMAQRDELYSNCSWTHTTLNGVNGYRVTGPNGNTIFLPQAGWGANHDGTIGVFGNYATCTLDSGEPRYCRALSLKDDRVYTSHNWRCLGRSIRPVYIGIPYKRIVIQDGNSFTSDTEQEVDEITYTRIFTDTEWQALYVPFEMQYEDWSADFDVARINNMNQYDDDEDGKVDRTVMEVFYVKDGHTEPNTPYLIRAKEIGEKTITLEDATLCKTEEQSFSVSSWTTLFTFMGTYSGVSGADMFSNGSYTLNGGSLCQAENDTETLSPMRWYMSVTDRKGNPESLGEVKVVVFGEEGTTGLRPIDNEQWTMNNGELTIKDVYDLSGRQLNANSQLKRGIYVIRQSDGTTKRVLVK